MKIVIIGGGISGFATYLALRQHLPRPSPPATDHEYTIYEAYDTGQDTTFRERPEGGPHSSTLIVGGGLGVGPNGLHVLQRLDAQLLRDTVQGGYVVDHSNLKSKHGRLLVRLDSRGACSSAQQTAGHQSPMHLLGTSRHSLWRCLRVRIPDAVIVHKRVSGVVANPQGRNQVHFTDGSPSVEADLVIGADGLKSTVKRALFPEANEDPYPPHYEGLVGIGGFVPSALVQPYVEDGSMNFVFGGNGFFGYFYADSASSASHRDSPYHVSPPGDLLGWWSTYSIDECPNPKDLDTEDVTRQLRERYSTWPDPVVQAVIASIHVENMWPMWTSPSLPTWERDGLVLVGDAAHALPPTSGQGSSQALEDAEALARILGHYLRPSYAEPQLDRATEKLALKAAAKQYMDLRRPRVQAILERAKAMQNTKRDMSFVQEYVMYLLLWLIGWFPILFSRQQRQVYDYDLPAEVNRVLARGGSMD
ncbi:putative extracellular salicylate hydroxylase/monooxygenase [Aspergillus heteromorphus CBS 117.55]|uniref:Putative extracellular salicylate hydroxylase/monooxygenase n=1 Tax=Aspergillus heteromorphus CBS 117.55 TaxID=1448321 RepID=A0A317VP36_9EURO|nr:putative extracellular salicylate hydroxylase/monooxygenase [Aspergillus heteromorphus CBS 117.55]PWY75369.1 putative extracellular salicylate hydroxylase/monooxygenase [Aspergillus heteromorphus CBS 117.55]